MEFEQGFADAERAAQAVEREAKSILKAAKAMEKAAQEGDIKKLRRAASSIESASDSARQAARNAQAAWPFSEAQEQDYLESQFTAEFLAMAQSLSLTVYSRDDRLIAFPSILRILAADRATKINRKRTPVLRPSHLAKILRDSQRKGSRWTSEQFLQTLYSAYNCFVPKNERGATIKLMDVYEALTLQPGAKQEYGTTEFALDLYMLDRSHVSKTKTGAEVSLPASTSARGSERDRITFFAPDGEPVTYYGLRFTERET